LKEKCDGVDSHFQIPLLPFYLRYFGYLIRGNRARFKFFYGRFLDKINSSLVGNYSLVIINQIEYLYWAGFDSERLAKVPIYLDIHEDNINEADRGPAEKFAFRNYWNWQLNQLITFVKGRKNIRITSVERVIADSYSRILNEPVKIIYNAPDVYDLTPNPVSETEIKLVHHGMGTKGRGIETTIKALQRLDKRFTLDLILFPTPLFRLKIEALSRILGVRTRMRILHGVPLSQLMPNLNKYDLSVIVLSGVIPGHLNALPNKLFESIQGKVAIVTGPNPSMAELVKEHNIGYVMGSWSVSDLVLTLNQASAAEISRFKGNTVLASRALSSGQSKEVFFRLIKDLLD